MGIGKVIWSMAKSHKLLMTKGEKMRIIYDLNSHLAVCLALHRAKDQVYNTLEVDAWEKGAG